MLSVFFVCCEMPLLSIEALRFRCNMFVAFFNESRPREAFLCILLCCCCCCCCLLRLRCIRRFSRILERCSGEMLRDSKIILFSRSHQSFFRSRPVVSKTNVIARLLFESTYRLSQWKKSILSFQWTRLPLCHFKVNNNKLYALFFKKPYMPVHYLELFTSRSSRLPFSKNDATLME